MIAVYNYITNILEVEELIIMIAELKIMLIISESLHEKQKIQNRLTEARELKRKYLTILN